MAHQPPFTAHTNKDGVFSVCFDLPLIVNASSLACEICSDINSLVLTDNSGRYMKLTVPLPHLTRPSTSALVAKFSKKRKELVVSIQLMNEEVNNVSSTSSSVSTTGTAALPSTTQDISSSTLSDEMLSSFYNSTSTATRAPTVASLTPDTTDTTITAPVPLTHSFQWKPPLNERPSPKQLLDHAQSCLSTSSLQVCSCVYYTPPPLPLYNS
jgi:hypothetical protein